METVTRIVAQINTITQRLVAAGELGPHIVELRKLCKMSGKHHPDRKSSRSACLQALNKLRIKIKILRNGAEILRRHSNVTLDIPTLNQRLENHLSVFVGTETCSSQLMRAILSEEDRIIVAAAGQVTLADATVQHLKAFQSLSDFIVTVVKSDSSSKSASF